MKNVVIIDCGSTLKEVFVQFGHTTAWIMAALKNSVCNFKSIKAYKGEKFNRESADAWIVTGSPRSVNDNDEWMLYLEDEIRSTKDSQIPVLGICFGHQIIAKSFGGTVQVNPMGWELGAYPIYLTKAGRCSPLFHGINNECIVYESHQDCVTQLPENAIKLAFNRKGIQAFFIQNNLYAVQFHPEFSWEIIKKYVSVRSSKGVIVDDPSLPKSNIGQRLLHNFIALL